jgi:hypothetical protein
MIASDPVSPVTARDGTALSDVVFAGSDPEVEAAAGAAGEGQTPFLDGWFALWGESTPTAAAAPQETPGSSATFPAAVAAALRSDEPRPAHAPGAGEWAVLSLAAWSTPGLLRSLGRASQSRFPARRKERGVG